MNALIDLITRLDNTHPHAAALIGFVAAALVGTASTLAAVAMSSDKIPAAGGALLAGILFAAVAGVAYAVATERKP